MKKLFKINTVVMHHLPHIDELLALYLLEQYGEHLYPGVKTAERVYIDAGSRSYNGRSAEQNLQEGILLLGVGGGMFDEHPHKDRSRIAGHCTATLVAKRLGISKRKELRQLIEYVRDRDLNGGDTSGRFGLATVIDTVSKHSGDSRVAERMAMVTFASIVKDQREFHGSSKEFGCNMSKEVLETSKGSINIAFGKTDNRRVHSYALGVLKYKVVIVGRSNGHVQIFCNKKIEPTVDMGAIAEAIRLAEAKACGNEVAESVNLQADGTLEGISQWCFYENAKNILNGTERALNVKPTKLSIEELKNIVVETVGVKELQAS